MIQWWNQRQYFANHFSFQNILWKTSGCFPLKKKNKKNPQQRREELGKHYKDSYYQTIIWHCIRWGKYSYIHIYIFIYIHIYIHLMLNHWFSGDLRVPVQCHQIFLLIFTACPIARIFKNTADRPEVSFGDRLSPFPCPSSYFNCWEPQWHTKGLLGLFPKACLQILSWKQSVPLATERLKMYLLQLQRKQ